MNREQRRELTVAQLKDHAEALKAQLAARAQEVAEKDQVQYSPIAHLEVAIDTIADTLWGDTRKRQEYAIAVWERLMQLYTDETVRERKTEALAEIERQQQRNRLLEGVNLGEKEARAILQVPNQ